MSYAFYKVLHYVGIFLVMAAVGGAAFFAANGGDKDAAPARKLGGMLHGIGMVLALVAGFGMHAKLGVDGMPGWFVAKLVIWLSIGGALAIPYRRPDLAKAVFIGVPLLGAVAAWLALTKPF